MFKLAGNGDHGICSIDFRFTYQGYIVTDLQKQKRKAEQAETLPSKN